MNKYQKRRLCSSFWIRRKGVLPCLCLLIVAVTASWLYISYLINRPMITKGGSPLIVEVPKNTTATLIVHMLHQKGLIAEPFWVLRYLQYKGYASRLKAGIYQITPGVSIKEWIHTLLQNKVFSLSFAIIEGTTVEQISDHLKKAAYLHYHPSAWQEILSSYTSAEGLLLADTYYYDAGSDATLLLQVAHEKLETTLQEIWSQRAEGLPYHHPYQLLIAASILEKETAVLAERKVIAGVIVNRLVKKMPLQMDPTIIYGLGAAYRGKLSHEDVLSSSAYNTYRHKGLPPTPIAMVSRASLEAAAHPLVSEYLYFVAKGDGSHFFSKTYEEQRKAIARYLLKR